MDWNAIILTLLGTTSFGGIWAALAYRKENKALKKNEVKDSDTNTQSQQIDLGVKYQTQMLELIEKVNAKQDSSAENQEKMLAKFDKLDERVDNTEKILGNIVTYLNGDYQHFLERQYGGRKPNKK